MSRIFLLLFLLPLSTIGQQKLNLTFLGGFANYSGDLQEKRFTLDQAGGAFGAGLSYELAPRLLAKGQLALGKIKAADKFSSSDQLRQRNLSFASTVIEGSLVLDYSFFDLQTHGATPYIFGGGSLFRFNPSTIDSLGNKVFLAQLGTEGQGLAAYPDRKFYKKIQISIPFGIGVRFRVTDNAWLGYEIGVRKTFTDYLDDVSKTYVDQDLLIASGRSRAASLAFRSDELKDNTLPYPPANAIRGGEKYKDWYYFSGITLSIGILNEDGKLFGRKINRGGTDCPRVVL
jgi:hypothetical protein